MPVIRLGYGAATVELTDDQFQELSKIGQRYAEER